MSHSSIKKSWLEFTEVHLAQPILLFLVGSSLFSFANVFFLGLSFTNPTNAALGSIQTLEGYVWIFSEKSGLNTWVPAKIGQKIYPEDFVHSEKRSSIEIQTQKGDSIHVLPDTSVRISEIESRPNVDVDEGSVFLNIYAGHQVIVQNSDLIIANKDSQLSINSLKLEQKKRLKIRSGEVHVYDVETQQEKRLFKLKSPLEVGQEIALQSTPLPSNKVSLSWTSDADDLVWYVEVAQDLHFENLVYQIHLNDETFVDLDVKPGRYYWRVLARRTYSRQTYPSGIGEFTVDEEQLMRFPAAETKKTIHPPHDLALSYSPSIDRSRLQWVFDYDAHRFRIRVLCEDDRRGFSAVAQQSPVYIGLRDQVRCNLQVKSVDNTFLSNWSRKIQVQPSEVGL